MGVQNHRLSQTFSRHLAVYIWQSKSPCLRSCPCLPRDGIILISSIYNQSESPGRRSICRSAACRKSGPEPFFLLQGCGHACRQERLLSSEQPPGPLFSCSSYLDHGFAAQYIFEPTPGLVARIAICFGATFFHAVHLPQQMIHWGNNW